MNTNKNSYIILYSTVMVVIVAFLLAFIYQTLKPMQDVNVALDKKKQILASLNIRDVSDSEAEAKYQEVVKAENTVGEGLTLYQCEVDGNKKVVVPVRGMGLWGPIWGYVALDDDKTTIFGAYFNHESETAGLGAEIKDSRAWQDQFRGKKVYSVDGKVVIAVKKKSDVKNPESECDAVTGATLTSDGVSLMLQESFEKYKSYLK
ncbi:NADH:ubiquinone reductase (Na(+)-transporting) subunit C [Prevotella sp. P2-180]|uniref:NADH:ubiquinone reductase (Na(+)-transporting) subunit C n=1 Tax=Prevotella sp. P2-180 TaxID=2024224 RepID=UPI000B95E3C4|nr:NADH:ubiquinone reductase (Na(+)-transporting) subunit C [Prevotella sp. P2-180]MCI6339061.1 NADH:ubiquinone reductase (Na(+)-transporting) subunit C [Prevotella sp.]MCI7088379.1 NADH:ubiquinone reductase (Na(+)-transporting) subunit C [Prevotella sp.]MCI7256256.1 NADH:ubiquinone reductase (Na(+)-transporting) subunit C [Prevotella sp.]MDD5783906.1 NADH:ubiquinone reductase (Na(+)-transporting) subunit C [Prevotella sp.]MDD6863088.1 NADH:ubiquinone reductase (Na(+)-transporting) subunit C [